MEILKPTSLCPIHLWGGGGGGGDDKAEEHYNSSSSAIQQVQCSSGQKGGKILLS